MKHFKSLSSATAASVLALSSVVTPIMASYDDPVTTETIQFNTTVTPTQSDKNITLPTGVKFKFAPKMNNEITPADFGETTLENLTTKVKNQIVANSTTGGNANIYVAPVNGELTPSVTSTTSTTDSPNVYGNSLTITLSTPQTAIAKPGVYYFELKETGHDTPESDSATTIDGLENSDDQKIIVAVLITHPTKEDENGDLLTLDSYEIGQVLWYKQNDQGSLEKIYDSDPTHTTVDNQNKSFFTANYQTGSVVIKKVVKGNLGEKDKQFEIKYNIESSNTGETYTYNLTNGSEHNQTDRIAKLKNDGTLTINGLSNADVVKIVEEASQNTDQGYTVTYTGGNVIADGTDSFKGGHTETGFYSAENQSKELTVTNTKNADVITGVVHNYGPFALMAAIGAAFIGFFFRRRREE